MQGKIAGFNQTIPYNEGMTDHYWRPFVLYMVEQVTLFFNHPKYTQHDYPRSKYNILNLKIE